MKTKKSKTEKSLPLTYAADCKIFPLLANPRRTPWSEVSFELGTEAMISGNVPAIQAALSNQITIQISIFGRNPDQNEAQLNLRK